MLKNNFLLILRRLKRKTGYSLIHLFGLTMGFTACLLIFLLIRYEYSFDQYHTNKDRVYRINTFFTDPAEAGVGSSTPLPLATAFREDFPEAEAVGTLFRYETFLGRAGNEPQKIDNLYFVEAEILDMLDFNILSGEGQNALAQPGNILLSESAANQFFGNDNPIGKELRLENTVPLQVAGIYKNPPAYTQFPAKAMISFGSLTDEIIGFPMDNWNIYLGGEAYALFPEPIEPEQYTDRLTLFANKYMNDEQEISEEIPQLQALSEIHLNPVDFENSAVPSVSPNLIWSAGSIGLLILLMACFNFINLSLASNTERGLEVSIRKVIGAKTLEIWGMSLGEAALLTVIALFASVGLLVFILPSVNQLLDKSLLIEELWSIPVLLFALTILILTVLVAGGYPAWMLARQKAKSALQSAKNIGQRGDTRLRQVIVVAQFVITLVIISGAITVARQLDYAKNKDLGFRQTGLLQIELPETGNNKALLESWRSNPSIENISFALGAPMADSGLGMGSYPFGGNPNTEGFITSVKTADENYVKTYGLELLAGRDLTAQDAQRIGEGYPQKGEVRLGIANETLGRKLGYDSPEEMLGKKVVISINDFVGEIVGVVKDFNNNSLHEAIEPVLITPMPPLYYQVGVALKTGQIDGTLADLEQSWKEFYPQAPFTYTFLEEYVQTQYTDEGRVLKLLNIFAGLAILIACLGLFGLAAIFTAQRRREVGLRKVLGASVANIVQLLSKDMVILITIAILLALPLSWWMATQWLQNFVYHIDFSWIIFAVAGVSLLFLAILFISGQTVRAALRNPVDVMREE